MPQAFISYSRVDNAFVEGFIQLLQKAFPNLTIWYDQSPHGLIGGDNWWEEILKAIAASDIFIYILSNESVNSPPCKAEFTEARRLQKCIIPIQARDKTKLPPELARIQFIDMKNGANDPEALARLTAAVNKGLSLAKKKCPLWKPATPKPSKDPPPTPTADAPDVDTRMKVHVTKRHLRRRIIFVVAVLLIVIAIDLIVQMAGGGGARNDTLQFQHNGTDAVSAVSPQPVPSSQLASPTSTTTTSTAFCSGVIAKAPSPSIEDLFPQAEQLVGYPYLKSDDDKLTCNVTQDCAYHESSDGLGLRLEYDLSSGSSGGWWAQWDTGFSVSEFEALRFWVKGEVGGEQFRVEVQKPGQRQGEALPSVDISEITTEFNQRTILLSEFADKNVAANLEVVKKVSFIVDGLNRSGSICFDDIKFVTEGDTQ